MGLFQDLWASKNDGDRLGTLSRRLDDVESEVRRIRVEWRDVLDRLDRLAGRIAKRQQRALEQLAEEPASTPEEQPESDFEREIRLRRGPTRAVTGGE